MEFEFEWHEEFTVAIQWNTSVLNFTYSNAINIILVIQSGTNFGYILF